MDTLKTVSTYTTQSSGVVQPPTKQIENMAGSVSAVDTSTAAKQVKPAEQNDLENKQQISNAVKEINGFFQAAQRSLQFNVDETSGHMVMQIKDSQTNEVIRQIPSEDVLKLAKRMDEITGVLFKAQA
jgi:flagellar protein FlaG